MAADDSLELDLLAASLRADAADLGAFVETLADMLTSALGASSVEIKRVRQGLRGPKLVREIGVDLAGERLVLKRDGNRVEALRAHVSGGIVLKSEQLGIDQWIQTLTELLAEQASHSAITRQALERLLLDP